MNKFSIKRTILYCLGGIFIVACSETGEENIGELAPKNTQQVETLHHVNMEKAKRNVLNFVNLVNKGTRASAKQWAISNIHPIVSPYTRNTTNEQEDTLLYIVNMADSAGFAIATADDRLPPILALIDEGNYTFNLNDTATSGFHLFMQAALNYCAQQKKMPQTRKTAPSYREISPDDPEYPSSPRNFEVMKPLLNCTWGQRDPYNNECFGNLTGCVVTASAQIMSFLEYPKQMAGFLSENDYRVTKLNWKQINEEAKHYSEPKSSETRGQIAALMRHLGIAFKAEYKQNTTSVDTEDAVDIMRKEFGCDVTRLKDYNCRDIINDLKCRNKIVIMSGKSRYYHILFFVRKYTGGHAWVVDGYIDYVTGWRSEERLYLHCNWGWNGNYNGYFLDNVFNTDTPAPYNDNAESTRTNYRYLLKYATFTKH